MKAILYTEYGPPEVLHLREVEKPVPGNDEVLVQVHAASLNAADWHLVRADPFLVRLMAGGLLRPRYTVPGADVAGRVEAIGRDVKELRPGDDVFGDISACGWGALAEYACAREDALVTKPAGMTFEEAAAVPLAAVTALQGLRDMGKIRAGQRVAVNGASGGVGTFALQIARAFGAHATAVCSSRNLEAARAIGADDVIDYACEDFTRNGNHYDLILAANGYHPILDYRRALSPAGICVMTGGSMAQMFQSILLGPWISRAGGKKMVSLTARPNRKDLALVKELIEAGKVAPVIDRRYPLSKAAEALRYLEGGHARGKVVITVVAGEIA